MILDDHLKSNLSVVFCGTAAGDRSAARGYFYAGPGNKFWPMLHRTGLTPQRLLPEDGYRVCAFGIGLTDLAKHHSGSDASLKRDMFDVAAFERKIHEYRPRFVAFNGKKAAATYLGVRSATLEFGHHERKVGLAQIFVLPSTSGAANGSWVEQPWHDLAALISAGTPQAPLK